MLSLMLKTTTPKPLLFSRPHVPDGRRCFRFTGLSPIDAPAAGCLSAASVRKREKPGQTLEAARWEDGRHDAAPDRRVEPPQRREHRRPALVGAPVRAPAAEALVERVPPLLGGGPRSRARDA